MDVGMQGRGDKWMWGHWDMVMCGTGDGDMGM